MTRLHNKRNEAGNRGPYSASRVVAVTVRGVLDLMFYGTPRIYIYPLRRTASLPFSWSTSTYSVTLWSRQKSIQFCPSF